MRKAPFSFQGGPWVAFPYSLSLDSHEVVWLWNFPGVQQDRDHPITPAKKNCCWACVCMYVSVCVCSCIYTRVHTHTYTTLTLAGTLKQLYRWAKSHACWERFHSETWSFCCLHHIRGNDKFCSTCRVYFRWSDFNISIWPMEKLVLRILVETPNRKIVFIQSTWNRENRRIRDC